MKITRATAIEAIAWLDKFPTPTEAQHQIAVQLTAIRPYTSRDLEAARAALNFCVSYKDDVQTRRIAVLRAIATNSELT